MKEQIQEYANKVKSFKFWRRSLLDAIAIGGLTSMVSGLGLTVGSTFDPEIPVATLKTLGVLFASGALTKVAEFWVRNPLSSIE